MGAKTKNTGFTKNNGSTNKSETRTLFVIYFINYWIAFIFSYIRHKVKDQDLVINIQFGHVEQRKNAPEKRITRKDAEDIDTILKMRAYWYYFYYTVAGYANDKYDEWFRGNPRAPPSGYTTAYDKKTEFFVRHIFGPVSDCFSRPVLSPAAGVIDVFDVCSSTLIKDCINLGSYNYLGFGGPNVRCVNQDVTRSIETYGPAMASPQAYSGQSCVHTELEAEIAEFLGKEACVLFGMGYGTNAFSICTFATERTLIISDSLNHASLIVGCRISRARIKPFKHNDVQALEAIIRDALSNSYAQPDNILIVVEGIYSMEGDILNLPDIVRIKKRYGAYLYVDEAHSICAIGPSGRGVCEYWGIDTRDVDILMGTFSKSFAAAGGYIASSRAIINAIRCNSPSVLYETSMAIGCARQILSSLRIISGKVSAPDGANRIRSILRNTHHFRDRLEREGFCVLGDYDSPVVPMMVYETQKMAQFSRECLRQGVAVVMVGAPATPIILCRVRFCMSSVHTLDQLDKALDIICHVAKKCKIHKINHVIE